MRMVWLFLVISLIAACGGGNDISVDTNTAESAAPIVMDPDAIDITNAIFDERSADCATYDDIYSATVVDIQRSLGFDGSVVVTAGVSTCTLTTNGIPNHNFNDATAAFASNVAEVNRTFEITRAPALAASPTALALATWDGVMLNGVVVDLLSAGCWGVGDGKIGCNNISTPYRYDPMGPGSNFGADANNAHPQPDGTYHYHGNPNAMFDGFPGGAGSPVIGFAADGFPIYGSYFYDGSSVRKAASGYTLKSGNRPDGPGGTYDGTFLDDWEFTDAGDLDACNGMTVEGQYGYYVTDTYPWVLGCHSGTLDPSFRK